MPLTLTKMASDIASVSFPYSGEEVHITYYPSRITEKIFSQALSLMEMDTSNTQNVIAGFASINEVLCTLIKSWDVYEDDAQMVMYPLVPDSLAALPINFRIKALLAISGDVRPEASPPQPN